MENKGIWCIRILNEGQTYLTTPEKAELNTKGSKCISKDVY